MGNYNNTLNSSDGFTSLPSSLYFNTYTTADDYLANGLQHAMVETNGLFNNSTANFVLHNKPWVVRDGLFSYNNSSGVGADTIGTRTVLSIK